MYPVFMAIPARSLDITHQTKSLETKGPSVIGMDWDGEQELVCSTPFHNLVDGTALPQQGAQCQLSSL